MRTALVTGGSGGIGKACGRKLVELGYDVVLAARREAPLRAAAEEIGARHVVADASDPVGFVSAVRPGTGRSYRGAAAPPGNALITDSPNSCSDSGFAKSANHT